MLFNVGKLIVSNYVYSSINQQLIAGRFSHKGLWHLLHFVHRFVCS